MLSSIPMLILVAVILGLFAFVARDVFRHRSGSAPALLAALFVLFVGERVFGEGPTRLYVSGLGVTLLLVAVALRAWAWTRSEGARRETHQKALGWTLVAAASLVFYVATLAPITSKLGLDEEGLARWNGSFRSLFPIVTLLGLLPTFLLDRLLSVHPKVLPAGAARAVQLQGVAGALAVALVFPVNYVARQREQTWDTAYFKTTKPGESTVALVNTAPEPLEAVLFFPPGNEVAREVETYFTDLAAVGGGHLKVTRVDQAVEPVRAEELKVRENGQIVLVRGETNQKFRIDLELDKAKKNLKELDSLVQKHLMKLTRDQRTVYFLTGHGEANWRENEDPYRKIAAYKKDVLEVSNFKVKTWGLAEGSSQRMPDDADVVVVAAPTKPISPEEIDALVRYWEAGGSLFLLVDPTSDPMTDLLAKLGLEAGTAPLAHMEIYAVSRKANGGPVDRVNLVTNKFGSHASVKTLSRNAAQAQMAFPATVAVKKAEGAKADKDKITTLVRTLPMTFQDANRNFDADPDEAKNVFDIATAVEHDVPGGEKKQSRAIVVGSVAWMADVAMRPSNAQFGYDAVRWLTRDEDVVGEIESEEDVTIVHTREEDWYWFLTAMFAMPTLVVAAGTIVVRSRRVR